MWKDLTLSDKARMMQLAVKSGISDLRTIQEVYNTFEEGGEIPPNGLRYDKNANLYHTVLYSLNGKEDRKSLRQLKRNPEVKQFTKDNNLMFGKSLGPGKEYVAYDKSVYGASGMYNDEDYKYNVLKFVRYEPGAGYLYDDGTGNLQVYDQYFDTASSSSDNSSFANGGRLSNIFEEGGDLGSDYSSGEVKAKLFKPRTWKYKGSPIYDESTLSFAQAFTDAAKNSNPYFQYNGNMYSTESDWEKKFTEKDFKTFAETMYPEVITTMQELGYPTQMAHNVVRQMGLESKYGTDPRGSKGFNLSGIKWTPAADKYNYTVGEDGEKYIDFDNLKDFIKYKLNTLNTNYGALDATSTTDFINRLHPKASGTKVMGEEYKGDYSSGYANYKATLPYTRSLDKYLLPLYEMHNKSKK